MNEELVSIITPVFNCEKFLPKTIECVLNQTYKNWEMLLVDDCAQDGSSKIITKYAIQDNRIKYFKHNKNKGASEARNRALMEAKGRFIAFLDADDLWLTQKLEKQVKFMIDKNYAFTNTDYEVIDENGNLKGKTVHMLKKIDYHGLLKNNLLQTSGIMIDTKKISKKLCYMSKGVEHEDTITWLKILKNGYYCYGLNEVLMQYRKVKASRSSNKKKAILGMWNLYRKTEKLNLTYSCYCFVRYALLALWKRLYSKEKICKKNMQVLLSTQNLKNDIEVKKLIKKMNIQTDYLIINQNLDNATDIKNKNVITKREKGLCKSRNLAIKNANADIILFSDDDVIYSNNYKKIILDGYKKYPKADIICFFVESKDKKRKIKRMKTGKIGYIKSMKIASVEMTCKRKSMLNNNLFFDEDFGIGSKNKRGEEQILLYEALKKGLKIMFINKKIGEVLQEKSSWFTKYDKDYFIGQGKIFKKLSNKHYKLLILQYAIRKYHLYHKDIKFKTALLAMLEAK